MTKKEMFKKIIEPSVLTGLVGAYNITVTSLSEKQEMFVDIISEDLYESLGYKLSVKDLQDRYSELFGREG